MVKSRIRLLNLDEREFLGEVYFNFIYIFHRRYSLFRDITRRFYVCKVYVHPNLSKCLYHRECKSLKEFKDVLLNCLESNCKGD